MAHGQDPPMDHTCSRTIRSSNHHAFEKSIGSCQHSKKRHDNKRSSVAKEKKHLSCRIRMLACLRDCYCHGTTLGQARAATTDLSSVHRIHGLYPLHAVRTSMPAMPQQPGLYDPVARIMGCLREAEVLPLLRCRIRQRNERLEQG